MGSSSSRARSGLLIGAAGLLWAVAYLLLWGIAWFGFMRSAWYEALGAARPMPWSEIWLIWAILCIPLGLALAVYMRGPQHGRRRTTVLVRVVLALWVPMTIGMYGWAWMDSVSLWLITIDSAVNLIAIGGASWLTGVTVGGHGSASPSVRRA
jgi:hypothetical protein